MSGCDWISPKKLREHYIDRAVIDIREAEKQLYLAVVTGQVRARKKGAGFDAEWLKEVRKFKRARNLFALPSDIVLSIEDTRRKWLPDEAE